MTLMPQRRFIIGLAVAALTFVSWSTYAGKAKTEEQLIADLAAPKEGVVTEALLKLEKEFPASTKWQPEVKKMLADPRETIRRKAGRVLGAVHAEVSDADLKNITAMFKGSNPQEVMDALKSLRGLKAQSTLPEILPLLQNPHAGIVRDALRTIATLGDKSHLPQVEALFSHADAKVKKDAQDAAFTLKSKN